MGLLSVMSRGIPTPYIASPRFGFSRNIVQTDKCTSLPLMCRRDWSSYCWYSAGSHACSPGIRGTRLSPLGFLTVLLVHPAAMAIAPKFIGVALQLVGIVFSIHSKIFLWRSFGIVAADRGIVVRGPAASSATPFTSGTWSAMSDSY